ncbi:MAG: prenylated flavin chaperone LpdD [Desulfitobacteriaceae bacterium]
MPDNIREVSNIQLETGEGRCRVSLLLIDTGAGIQGLLLGGEKPHIGGCVLGVPRPSLTGEGWGVDLYITPVPNHKDVNVASRLAKDLARVTKQPVVVTAGIHSDSLTAKELKDIMAGCSSLSRQACQILLVNEVSGENQTFKPHNGTT